MLVNSNIAVTNDAGIFVVALSSNTSHVKIQLQQHNYTVVYPTAGYVAVPRDLNDMPEIIIRSYSDNSFINQYLDLYKAIKNDKAVTSIELKSLNNKLDSLQKILLQLNYSETEIRTAKDMQDGKDKYYPEISQNMNDFVSRAFDLKTSFQYVASFAFDNPSALQKLHDAVTEYTNIYNILNRQRNNYQKEIQENWQDDSLTMQYTTFINYALDSIHTAKLFPLQSKITLINEYFSGKKSAALKEKIQQQIKEQNIILQPMLEELKKRNDLFQKYFIH